MIRYSLFDLSEIKVYTVKNQFLCTAKRVTKAHPMAYYLGDIKDVEDLKQKIQKQKRLKNKTIKELQKFLPNVDLIHTKPSEIYHCRFASNSIRRKKLR